MLFQLIVLLFDDFESRHAYLHLLGIGWHVLNFVKICCQSFVFLEKFLEHVAIFLDRDEASSATSFDHAFGFAAGSEHCSLSGVYSSFLFQALLNVDVDFGDSAFTVGHRAKHGVALYVFYFLGGYVVRNCWSNFR